MLFLTWITVDLRVGAATGGTPMSELAGVKWTGALVKGKADALWLWYFTIVVVWTHSWSPTLGNFPWITGSLGNSTKGMVGSHIAHIGFLSKCVVGGWPWSWVLSITHSSKSFSPHDDVSCTALLLRGTVNCIYPSLHDLAYWQLIWCHACILSTPEICQGISRRKQAWKQ